MKTFFISAPVLLHPDLTKHFIVETDVSDFVVGTILSQPDEDGVLHLVVYYSHKLTTPEINSPIYDKELAAIIFSFEGWRPYLAGAQYRVQVATDHKNLLYFTSTRTFNRHQDRRSILLVAFDFKSIFLPEDRHNKADALSRRSELAIRLLFHYHIHNIFHVSLLEVYYPYVGWQPTRPLLIELVYGEEYEVEEILDSKLLCRKLYFLVLWKGFLMHSMYLELYLGIFRTFGECTQCDSRFSPLIPTQVGTAWKTPLKREDNVMDTNYSY